MVAKALFTNTLIALPTGLGKTFIAAVVMYNYFRWFPEGNVLHRILTFYLSDAVFYELVELILKLCSYLQWKFRENHIYLPFTSSCYSANWGMLQYSGNTTGTANKSAVGDFLILFREKSIFGHPIIVRVCFWPCNSQTSNPWPPNYQYRTNLAI